MIKSMTRTATAVIVSSLLLSGCADDGGDDLAATCEQMATIEGPEDITVERLDALLAVAPDAIATDIQLVRDRLAAEGEAAYDDDDVGAAFERIGGFEDQEC